MTSLITEHLDIWTAAREQKKTGGRGRGKKANGGSLYGIKRLRELILELAVRGKLVPQNPEDEPASVLLQKIAKEKARLVKEGKIKKQKKLPEITEDEKPFELPEGWEHVRLGFISCWAIGSGFPKKEQGLDEEEILFSKVSDMNLVGNEKFITSTVNTVSLETCNRLKLKIHSQGTVIFPKIGGAIATNKRRILIKSTVIDNNCLGVTPLCGISSEYLFLYLTSIDFTKYQVGTSVPALGQGTLELIKLGLPPLLEQHRIVAKVDELMALCDRLEQQQTDSDTTHQTLLETLLATLTNAADHDEFNQAWQRLANHFDTLFTTEQSIDQLKQTILQLAVMGKLVRQNHSDEPADVLLKKITKEKARLIKEGKIKKQKKLPGITEEEKPFALPVGWEWVRLYALVFLLGDGLHGTPEYTPGTNYYFVNGNNLNNGKIEIKQSTKTISHEEMLKYKKNLSSNAVLVSINGTLGNVAFYNGEDIILGKSACYFNLSNGVLKYFMKIGLESPYFMSYALRNATGSTIKNLSLKAMKGFPVLLPPLAEQRRIVAKVDELMALCDTLKDRLHEAQATQINLADSIVDQAVA